METRTLRCPSCSAPLEVPLGEVETGCEFCGSHLRLMPSQEELEVVRTREEMKYRERLAVQKIILNQKLQQEEAERWRRTAARVAIASLPVMGEALGRGLFRTAIRGSLGGSRAGCGCLGALAGLGLLLAAACAALLR